MPSNPKKLLRISDLKEYPYRDALASNLKNLELYFFDKKKTLRFSDYRGDIVFQGVAIYKRKISNVFDGLFVSFLKENSKGIRFETYYIDEENLPYLYKNIIFDESGIVVCTLGGVGFVHHSRGTLTTERPKLVI